MGEGLGKEWDNGSSVLEMETFHSDGSVPLLSHKLNGVRRRGKKQRKTKQNPYIFRIATWLPTLLRYTFAS